ncbi:MAG: hypothetical protein C4295_07015 [Candidatus Fervidibacterota bacterium]
MLQREIPTWVAIVAVVVVVLVVIGVYFWLWRPRVREGAQPPPTAPIFKAPGPGVSPIMEKPSPEQPAPSR